MRRYEENRSGQLMPIPDGLQFFRRTMPSANMVLVSARRGVLIDTGFGGDWLQTERLLRDSGMPPERLELVVNTHFHCDHEISPKCRSLRPRRHKWPDTFLGGRSMVHGCNDRETDRDDKSQADQKVESRFDDPVNAGRSRSNGRPVLQGLDVASVLRTANAAAAMSCRALGAQGDLPTRGELEAFLNHHEPG